MAKNKRVDWDDMEDEQRWKLLRDAVKQLQERFDDHDHGPNGNVRIGIYHDTVDLDHTWEE